MHQLKRTFPALVRRHLTQSAVSGPLEPPLSYKTLPQFFQTEVLEKHAERPALISRMERPGSHGGPSSRNLNVSTHLAWDFHELDEHGNALARGLLAMGVQKGDRVGVIMGNNSAYAMLQWACASIGAILVTMNPAYRLPELVATLNLSGAKHLFVVPQLRSSMYVQTLVESFPEIVSARPGELNIQSLPALRNIVVVDNTEEHSDYFRKIGIKSVVDWREVLIWRADVREAEIHREIMQGQNKDEVINLQFTSGTTGAPKAVSLTHHNVLNNAISSGRCMRLTKEDILCNAPPLFHCSDDIRLILGNLAAWVHGSCVVYPSDVFDPSAVVDAVIAERCTALHGVATHFLGVLSEVDKRKQESRDVNMRSLRTGITGGSPVPFDLMKSLMEKIHLRELTNAYGMTETSPVSFQSTPDDPIAKRVETVGKVQPHVKAKIIGCDGKIVSIGKPGEICTAGYLLQKGYWNDEEQTQSVMKKDEDGTLWMHTGDEGIMDEEGYLRVVGRIKDIIVRGGENLSPAQIENALTARPGIWEAAAVSVPDATYGEVVGIWIVRQPHTKVSREGVRKRVTDRINPQNAPAWVWFMGEDGAPEELPKTASGKVMKHVLRKWANDMAAKNIGRVSKL